MPAGSWAAWVEAIGTWASVVAVLFIGWFVFWLDSQRRAREETNEERSRWREIALNWDGKRKLRNANLERVDLYEVQLEGADLRSANLAGAILNLANLAGADLTGANLRGAEMEAANLRSAILRDADMRGASLWLSSLEGADLIRADLRGTRLNDVFLEGANLSMVLVDRDAYWPPGIKVPDRVRWWPAEKGHPFWRLRGRWNRFRSGLGRLRRLR